MFNLLKPQERKAKKNRRRVSEIRRAWEKCETLHLVGREGGRRKYTPVSRFPGFIRRPSDNGSRKVEALETQVAELHVS
jgi:hypothetical protein